jgi:hypothetical protein
VSVGVAVGVTVGVSVAVGVGVGVAVAVGVSVGGGVGVSVGVAVGVTVGVSVAVGVGVGVAVAVGVSVGVAVGVTVGVSVAVGVGVVVGVLVAVAVGVSVGVLVGVGVGVVVGVLVAVAVGVAVGDGVSVGVLVGVGVGATTVRALEPVGPSSWLRDATLLGPLVYTPTALAVTFTLTVQEAWPEFRVPPVTEMVPLPGLAVIAPVPLGQVVDTPFGLATVSPGASVSANDHVLAAISDVLVMVKVSVAELPCRMVVGLKALVNCGVESVTTTSSMVGPHGPGVVLVKVSGVVAPGFGASDVPRDVAIHCILVVLLPLIPTSNDSWGLVNDPKLTVKVLFVGDPPHVKKFPAVLPASANETE